MTHSPLTTGTTPYGNRILKRNPRNTSIDMFIVHHAATTDLQGVKNIFAMDGGRGTSAQYIVKDDQIIGSVPEEWRAWTGGGKRDGAIYDGSTLDRRAITVETVNSGVAQHGWPISARSFESLARLIEDCSRRYGFPLDRNHVIGHREMLSRFKAGFATVCPGGIDVDGLVRRAQEIRNGGTSTPKPPPVKTPEQIEDEEFMTKLDDFTNLLKGLPEKVDAIAARLEVLESRLKREIRPGIYFMNKGADGKTYTVDNSPYACVLQPATGFILPLDPPDAQGKRPQIERLLTAYRIVSEKTQADGFDELVYFNTLKDVARGSGIIPRRISAAEGVAWARREIHGIETPTA